MGKQARLKRERRQQAQRQVPIEQVGQTWLGKKVAFDLGQGEGVQYGQVVEISEDGDVVIECLPGYDRRTPLVMMSLAYVDQMLTIVEE